MKPVARLARPQDEAGLRRLLRELPVGEEPALAYEREPAFFAGPPAQTLAVFSGPELRGMVSRRLRPGFVNGRPAEVGAVNQLRARPGGDALAVLGAGAAGLRRLHRDGRAPYYLVTLAGAGARSSRLLQSGRLGLPQPAFREKLVTLSFATGPLPRMRTGDPLPAWPGRRAFLNRRLRDLQFGSRYGREPRDGREWVAVTGQGGLRGLTAVLDENAYKQIRVARLPAVWRSLRPFYNAVMPRWRRWPALPAEGTTLDSASLTGFCAVDLDAAERLLDAALAVAARRGLQALNLCLSEGHPLLAGLRRRGGLAIESQLALLHWPDAAEAIRRLDGRPAHLDASDL